MSTADLGVVKVLGADAVGQPGQRRFRLFVQGQRPALSAIMWLEKEQLSNLSLALDRVLAQLTEGRILRTEAQAGPPPRPIEMPATFPKSPDYEFQIGRLLLNYEERRELLALIAVPMEIRMEPGSTEPQVLLLEDEAISFLFTFQQAQELTRSISTLISSGRPICPLCHTPLDGGPHACVKQNGHREIVQIVEDDEEEEEE
ncbi:MAG TPA: DUF3090 family protein [Ktedonobacteraceae bacterium]|nr:DUF3090 family protein [Ktedonobacteraceae bacterium]